jgi:hypothetical protein
MPQVTEADHGRHATAAIERGDTIRLIGRLQSWIVTRVDGTQLTAWTSIGQGAALVHRTGTFTAEQVELVRRGNRLADYLTHAGAALRALPENG